MTNGSLVKIIFNEDSNLKDKTHNIIIVISGKTIDGKKIENTEIIFSNAETEIAFGPFAAGEYSLKIATTIGLNGIYFPIEQNYTALKINGTDTLSITTNTLMNCKYTKSLKEQICPICHKSEHVLPILYRVYDPETEGVVEQYYSLYHRLFRRYTGCSPFLYCSTDKLEF
jgi:hypothetical protein